MREKCMDSIPRYQQIAIEIASRIVNGEYPVGERISGRSAITSQYSVSPETARRAFCVLDDLKIVAAERGSGTRVVSKENAERFLRQFSNQKNLESIKEDILQSIERQQQEMSRINALLSELIMATEHYRSMNPLAPYTIRVTASCVFLEKTIQDIQLWQHTGATLVAIRREEKLLLSPGPYATLKEGDMLYFITQDLSDQHVMDYLYHLSD